MAVLDSTKQPFYEVIKREDLIAAFKSAMRAMLDEILTQIEELTTLYSATAASSLWSWGYTSRWDYDMWW
jgi:hypothetical protein